MLPLCAKSQLIQKLDSLHYSLKTAENDSVRMELLNGLYLYYAESNRDSAMFFTDLALAKSKEINQPLWTAYILINKAYLLQRQGNLSLPFKLLNESMSIAKDEKSEENVFFPASLKSSWHNPHEGRLYILGGVFHNLGNTYRQAGNPEKAILCYKEVIRITEENKEKNSFLHASMNIGAIYLELNQLDSAILYSRNAIKFSNSSGSKTYQGIILKIMGDIYSKQNQLDSAKFYYWRSIIVSREQNNVTSEIAANIALAQLYEGIAQTDSMFYYAKAGFRMSSGLKAGAQMASSAELISTAFKRKGNPDSALTYLSISKKMADSLNKVRTEKLMEFQNIGFEDQMQLEKAAQESVAYKNKVRTIGLITGLGLLSILAFVFYRNNRQRQKANIVLREQKDKVESALQELKSTQSQLIQSEKMASLGELTAGIAHEIQNPLNFVNNFSELSNELIEEMQEEMERGNSDEVKNIVADIRNNLEKINLHGKRADAIVKGMLEHSRTTSGEKQPTDINALADQYLRLAYQGLLAKDKNFNLIMKTAFDDFIGNINIIPQDIGRVLLNLFNNAFYALSAEAKAKAGYGYEPTILLKTRKLEDKIEIIVRDNGGGIPEKLLDKVFQPFFTTKPTGQGTGLGLSLSYDIIKAHQGTISIRNDPGEGAEFIITLPINA